MPTPPHREIIQVSELLQKPCDNDDTVIIPFTRKCKEFLPQDERKALSIIRSYIENTHHNRKKEDTKTDNVKNNSTEERISCIQQ